MCLRGGRRMTKDKFHQKKIQWEHLVAETSKRFPERKDEFNTSSHINVDRLYYQEHDENYLEKLGFPGQYPFTRGIQPTMYRGRFWTMRQYDGFFGQLGNMLVLVPLKRLRNAFAIYLSKDKQDFP